MTIFIDLMCLHFFTVNTQDTYTKLLLAFQWGQSCFTFFNICLTEPMSFYFSNLCALTKRFKTCHIDNDLYIYKCIHIYITP